jgi:glycosyltransferase involved in cell wall biosynthesis
MRFVLVSTHTDQTTGYAKVAHNLLRQLATLAPKVKTYHFGFQRHPNRPGFRKCPEGIVQYDAAANEDPKEEGFGFNKIHEYLEMVGPDVVMIYNDPLIIYKFIEAMKHERGKAPYKLWIYVDQVYTGIAPQLVKTINDHSDRIYCFSEIWKQRYLEYDATQDVRVLEHAVDATTFTHMTPEQRIALRKNMNIPENAVLLLNANRNSQRKRLDLTIAGFVRAISRCTEVPLYLMIVTNLNPQAGAYYDIPRIYAEELRVASLDVQTYAGRLLLVDTSPPNAISDETINNIYNIGDIGINTSDGEGFGLCQLEHLYTGAPQIVTDVGSYRTFLDTTTAEFVPPSGKFYFAGGMPHGFSAPTFSVGDVTSAMERAVKTLPEKRNHIQSYQFKSWSSVCDEFLEDLLMSSEGRASTVSVPVRS